MFGSSCLHERQKAVRLVVGALIVGAYPDSLEHSLEEKLIEIVLEKGKLFFLSLSLSPSLCLSLSLPLSLYIYLYISLVQPLM